MKLLRVININKWHTSLHLVPRKGHEVSRDFLSSSRWNLDTSFLKVPWKQKINAGNMAVVGKALCMSQAQENRK
jgi:hypothetical protein